MSGRWQRLLLLLSLAGAAGGPAARPAFASAAGVPVEWRAAAPQWTPAEDGRWQVTVPGFRLAGQPGQPRLPVATALVALPPGATPQLDILALDQTWQPAPGPLAAAPGAGTEPPAAAPLTVTLLGEMRGVGLARVSFYPVWPDGAGVRVTTHVRAVVRFTPESAEPAQLDATPADDPLLAVVAAQVVNPDDVRAAPAVPRLEQPAAGPGPTALVAVAAAGLTALTAADLQAAGFPVGPGGVDPASLRLERAGAAVDMDWDGDGDAVFGPDERLLFYAAPRPNRYTAEDVYRLSAAAGPVARLAARPGLDAGVGAAGPAWTEAWFETNTIYTPPACRCAPGWDGDPWMWEYLSRPGMAARSFPFTLTALDTAQPAALTVWLLGFTQGAHHADISVNGTPVGAAVWSGQTLTQTTLTVPAGLLAAGANALTLALPNTDGVWLDAFQVRHARAATAAGAAALVAGAAAPQRYTVALTATADLRVYDVTVPDHPLRLTGLNPAGGSVTFSDLAGGGGRRYLVAAAAGVQRPAAVRAPYALSGAAGANYLIISHPDFISALGPLIALRQAQGLSVVVEDVRAVYDAADGRPTPQALQAFLTAVFQTWTPRPAYVLLVGDGTFDPRHYRADSQATFIPPFLADVDPELGETAADNRFVTVAGADTLPDFALGRLPVDTLAEAQTVVAKLVNYETAPPVGLWNSRALFVADDADGAGDFAALAEAGAAPLPAPWTARRLYYAPAGALTDFRRQLAAEWYTGASVVVYHGHASQRQWGAENFLHLETTTVPHVAGLLNAGRLPIVLEMTCLTGSFHDAGRSSLDEGLLRQPDGGAVGVWGATGLGLAAGHATLTDQFLAVVYQAGQPRVGPAALAGKLQLVQSGEYLDLVDTFGWLGDPATQVRLTLDPGYPNFLPLIGR